MPKTILAFDSWTKGRSHFTRLVRPLAEHGYQLVLIHIGSWGHEPTAPEEEVLEGLRVRDIRFYRGKSFDEILQTEQPAAVLFLSTRAFAHQAMNRYAAARGIPTMHLYHGLVSVQAVGASESAYKVSWARRAHVVWSRAYKNISRLWPVYLRSLKDTNASMIEYLQFAREIYAKAVGQMTGPAPADCTTTAGCVYTQADLPHMVQTYSVPAERVSVVGNPDLINFAVPTNAIGAWAHSRENNRTVTYIETGLAGTGLVYETTDAFIGHIAATAQSLESQGYELIVKLKPHSLFTRAGGANTLRSRGVTICKDEEFLSVLQSSAAAIVEPSTAALLPALLGLPLLLANYGPLAQQQYGTVLHSYPFACPLEDLSIFGAALARIDQSRPSRRSSYATWLAQNSGPLPADEMPSRVSVAIQGLLNGTGQDSTSCSAGQSTERR